MTGGIFWVCCICRGSNRGRYRVMSLYSYSVENPGVSSLLWHSCTILLLWRYALCGKEGRRSVVRTPVTRAWVECQKCDLFHSSPTCQRGGRTQGTSFWTRTELGVLRNTDGFPSLEGFLSVSVSFLHLDGKSRDLWNETWSRFPLRFSLTDKSW